MVTSFELGCDRTRYFNMLPSLESCRVDNFHRVGRHVFAEGSDQKRLPKPETEKEFLR